MLNFDFLAKLNMLFVNNLKNFLFLKNYQQLFTNVSRENPIIQNKLDKITYTEVLSRIFTHNKSLDPALENMADASNDDVSNLKISKPILEFFDKKIEMDYVEYSDMKITIPFCIYLATNAIFLIIDIIITGFEGQSATKIIKITYIICGLILLLPQINQKFSKAFSIYLFIILTLEIIMVYVEKRNDNDTKICLQAFVLLSFPLYNCPQSKIVTLLTFYYLIGITPSIYLNDYGFNKDDTYFMYSNLNLLFLRHIAIYDFQ